MPSIFYEGDLQSGISLALNQSKSVVCFIRDEGEESFKWEHEYLKDAQIEAALADRAITLRILAGSQEADFFSAYYPVQAVPSLSIIHNGSLTLNLKSGQDKAAFKAGILTSLIAASSTPPLPATLPSTETAPNSAPDHTTRPSSSQEPHVTSPGNQRLAEQPDASGEDPASEPSERQSTSSRSSAVPESATSSTAPSSSNQQSVVQRLLDERRRKLEVDKKQKEEAEKADRKAKAEARQQSISVDANSAKAKQATFAQEQRKRNVEAKLERDRVLRQIEQDKIDRREREDRRKALAKAETEGGTAEDLGTNERQGTVHELPSKKNHVTSEARNSKDCAVQVRLFDGSTIRNKFSADQNLTEIRAWVDEERSDDYPFTFKQILSPSPNRPLTISEENESLVQLGLVPSATLVMIPIKSYTAAYTSSGPNIFSTIVTFLYTTFFAAFGLVSRALDTFLGLGQAATQRGAPTVDQTQPEARFDSPDSGIKIRTLYDKRKAQDEHQLYNGNQINVQPRNDDPDKDE